MSLYKTQRCRHFDEAGHAIKPYCSQGNKCRFIHPNDHQWDKLRRRNDDSPSPESRETVLSKGKNKRQSSPGSHHRQRSSPLVPQTDLFKRKQRDHPREHDHRDLSSWNSDRRRDSEPWGYARERHGPSEPGYSLKRANDQDDLYPNHRPRLSDRSLHGSISGGDTRHTTQTDKKAACSIPLVSAHGSKTTIKVSETFHRLAKLCCEIVQDTCFLDREQDKLKAFTGLSSELSRAVPDAAVAVTPALATVITGHTRTRERLESHLQELEGLWKTLFSILEGDITKVIDSRLEQAITLLSNEKDSALQAITRLQRVTNDKLHDGTMGHRSRTDGLRETATLSERGVMSVNGGFEDTCHRGGSTSLSLAPTKEIDIGSSLRAALEEMKMQMDRQTRAIELLAKENLQLKSATESLPRQLAPPDSASSSPRKPLML